MEKSIFENIYVNVYSFFIDMTFITLIHTCQLHA
jgi:hypothetical protein